VISRPSAPASTSRVRPRPRQLLRARSRTGNLLIIGSSSHSPE
jgi:hypothetical protein